MGYLILFNARSVKNNWLDACHAINIFDASIVAITETWFSSANDSVAYSYKDYAKFVSYRTNKAGGGTMFLVKKDYNAVKITAPLTIPNSCDCTIIKIGCLASALVSIYRPLNYSKEDTLQLLDALECILSANKNVSILGDFNLPGLNWLDELPLAKNELSATLVELISFWVMTQVVCEPSRGENWLDLIITTIPYAYNTCHVRAPVASSDHNIISCVINIPQ